MESQKKSENNALGEYSTSVVAAAAVLGVLVGGPAVNFLTSPLLVGATLSQRNDELLLAENEGEGFVGTVVDEESDGIAYGKKKKHSESSSDDSAESKQRKSSVLDKYRHRPDFVKKMGLFEDGLFRKKGKGASSPDDRSTAAHSDLQEITDEGSDGASSDNTSAKSGGKKLHSVRRSESDCTERTRLTLRSRHAQESDRPKSTASTRYTDGDKPRLHRSRSERSNERRLAENRSEYAAYTGRATNSSRHFDVAAKSPDMKVTRNSLQSLIHAIPSFRQKKTKSSSDVGAGEDLVVRSATRTSGGRHRDEEYQGGKRVVRSHSSVSLNQRDSRTRRSHRKRSRHESGEKEGPRDRPRTPNSSHDGTGTQHKSRKTLKTTAEVHSRGGSASLTDSSRGQREEDEVRVVYKRSSRSKDGNEDGGDRNQRRKQKKSREDRTDRESRRTDKESRTTSVVPVKADKRPSESSSAEIRAQTRGTADGASEEKSTILRERLVGQPPSPPPKRFSFVNLFKCCC